MSDLRQQCIEAGRDAMGRNDGWRWWHPRHLGRLFDLWEPIIRADEESTTRWIELYRALVVEAEAEVRERIAQELEQNLTMTHKVYLDDDPYGSLVIHDEATVRADAARIARGGAK